MSDREKLRPDRDLQCYFCQPSSVAALSETSAAGFTVSGCWRQQFDWAVVEWNRDNVFEHPALRNLPDGDLSGLQLSYRETRTNAIPLDSLLYPTVDWPYLRVWATKDKTENIYKIRLREHATAVEGAYQAATATFELQGTAANTDYVELTWLDEHYTVQLSAGDQLSDAIKTLTDVINQKSATMHAAQDGTKIKLSYDRNAEAGANGNRIGVYGNTTGAENWSPKWQLLSGGTSPSKWRIDLDFRSITDVNGLPVPMKSVRKLRWTWAADLQTGAFARNEFAVVVSNWTVTGNRGYQVQGPGSRRIEDDAPEMKYSVGWTEERGNYSGGSIRYSAAPGSSVVCTYQQPTSHQLYLGTRIASGCGAIRVSVDGKTVLDGYSLAVGGEDVLVRLGLGTQAGQSPHTVTVTHCGGAGTTVYFDFLEAAAATSELPAFAADPQTTLATDWDTDHSLALAPERTAWLIYKLGFRGRANHYIGAMWFYELCRPGHQYATGSITFAGTPDFGGQTHVWLGPTQMDHVNLIGDTAESIAKAFELLINAGSTGVWAHADGAVLTIQSRTMGQDGNSLTISAQTGSSAFTATRNGPTLAGGTDGTWRTDATAVPRLNRAVRDWSRSYYKALKGYGMDVAAAFSTELKDGDDTTEAGIAQRYPDGTACWVNTPALQTNFSPASTAYWQQVYADMAQVMTEAGVRAYLQFGEIQWWYFPAPHSGMPFYDDYTKTSFQAKYGRTLPVFADGTAKPAQYPQECAFLSSLIGQYTNAVMAFVRRTCPDARFEVLYPPDVNEAPLNQAVNLPAEWTPATLDCFKTENFSFTYARDMNKAKDSILLPMQLGFAAKKSSHLVGIGEYTTPWQKESDLSEGQGLESVVLFALDQFCLIGYAWPATGGAARSLYMGS